MHLFLVANIVSNSFLLLLVRHLLLLAMHLFLVANIVSNSFLLLLVRHLLLLAMHLFLVANIVSNSFLLLLVRHLLLLAMHLFLVANIVSNRWCFFDSKKRRLSRFSPPRRSPVPRCPGSAGGSSAEKKKASAPRGKWGGLGKFWDHHPDATLNRVGRSYGGVCTRTNPERVWFGTGRAGFTERLGQGLSFQKVRQIEKDEKEREKRVGQRWGFSTSSRDEKKRGQRWGRPSWTDELLLIWASIVPAHEGTERHEPVPVRPSGQTGLVSVHLGAVCQIRSGAPLE